jgi:hypothetical protein
MNATPKEYEEFAQLANMQLTAREKVMLEIAIGWFNVGNLAQKSLALNLVDILAENVEKRLASEMMAEKH